MYKALVVEDEEDIRNLLVDQLKDMGCRVRSAADGAAALNRLREMKPDIIFVDIMMPVMDGIDLITELQGNTETADLPVVLVTAVSTPAITLKAIELGVKYRLAKPWEQDQLDYVFEQALNITKPIKQAPILGRN
ncbi:MAG: response regulator [Chloroflexi bacterium]|nr:response regulator [Chloroflexota bacterium]